MSWLRFLVHGCALRRKRVPMQPVRLMGLGTSGLNCEWFEFLPDYLWGALTAASQIRKALEWAAFDRQAA